MGSLLVIPGGKFTVPALFAPSPQAGERFIEFFTANIRNANTRAAYAHAVGGFASWCDGLNITSLAEVRPTHVAAFVETLLETHSAPTVKQRLAAIRALFDWLVVGQVVPFNPASSVRGPKHSVKEGKTPVLSAEEARALLDAMDISTLAGLRDRALIATLVFTFARVSAALSMRVEDVFTQGRRTWVRLHEKGGKEHKMPCHHKLEDYLHAYIEAACLTSDGKAWLFQSMPARTGKLSGKRLARQDVYRMVQRYLVKAKIDTKAGCHSWRATGLTDYLRNGGRLEVAQEMANHADMRTTRLYDRRSEQVTQAEVERIGI